MTVEWPFPADYTIEISERIERLGIRRVLGYPGATPVEPNRELSSGAVLTVKPNHADAWVGIFDSFNRSQRSVSWPDGRSVCVFTSYGSCCVVRADDPMIWFEAVMILPRLLHPVVSHGLVVLGDWTHLIAYDADGLAWESQRLVLDDLKVLECHDDVLRVQGLDPGGITELEVDLATGRAL